VNGVRIHVVGAGKATSDHAITFFESCDFCADLGDVPHALVSRRSGRRGIRAVLESVKVPRADPAGSTLYLYFSRARVSNI